MTIDRYRVGQALSFRPIAEGLLNRGYEVVTTRGRWFLKHYLDQRPDTIRFQHRTTQRLAACGIPAIAPVTDRRGRTVLSSRGRWFALYPWVDGIHRRGTDLDARGCARVGALLGGVHVTLPRLLPPIQQPLLVPTADPHESLATIERLLTGIRARPESDSFDRLAELRLIERRALLLRHAHRRPRDHDAPHTGYVHGDFHPLNVLYQGNDPVAIIDWDRLAALPHTEELVRAALIFFTDRISGTLDLDRVRGFVGGYRATLDPGPTQLAAAVHRLWWERLNDFWMLTRHYLEHDPRCAPLFPASAALIVWWTMAYDEVLEAFLG
ncbi:phosphotransferase [Embleya sp. NPDC056575]|uniref:phosphotransferase n=1 Tax=unclassified Embleya TaxID=2699296 RepID=UPI0036881B35